MGIMGTMVNRKASSDVCVHDMINMVSTSCMFCAYIVLM